MKLTRKVVRPATGQCRAAELGVMLIECLVYTVVVVILLNVGFAAFYYSVENSFALRRNAHDIGSALSAGERWRADVRAASGRVRIEDAESEQILRLPGVNGEVAYQFHTNAVLRRVNSGPWTCVLTRVKSSNMEADKRSAVTALRWELELQPRSPKAVRVRPLFTFMAVPEKR